MSWTKITAKCILVNIYYAKYLKKIMFIDYVVRFAIVSYPLPKRILHSMRSSTSPFKFQYILPS